MNIREVIKSIKSYINDKQTSSFDWDAMRAKIKTDEIINEDIRIQRKEILREIKRACNRGRYRVFVPILYPANVEYLEKRGYRIYTTEYMTHIHWGEKIEKEGEGE